MSNIKKIIGREYWTRVRKKSFIIMTLLTPLLIVGFYAAMVGVGIYTATEKADLKKAVLINNSSYIKELPDTMGSLVLVGERIEFDSAINELQEKNAEFDVILTLGDEDVFEDLSLGYYSLGSGDSKLKNAFKGAVSKVANEKRMELLGIDKNQIDSTQVSINFISKKVDDKGITDNNETIKGVVGLVFAMLIYFFIFIFAMQVMRGVMEEKTNRIVEVVISTVRPFELMFGKIVGIALVGLTQVFIWVVLSSILLLVGNLLFAAGSIDMSAITGTAGATDLSAISSEIPGGNSKILSVIGTLTSMPWLKIVVAFIGLFMGGYLFNSSIFAAIGSAVDSETDTQQFMLPVTLPLVLGIVVAQMAAFTNPHGDLAFWCSIIPLTSPIVMMVRACFDLPWWELLLSLGILYVTFFFMVRLVAKIYRIGILTYGKKPTWKQMFKWVFSKS